MVLTQQYINWEKRQKIKPITANNLPFLNLLLPIIKIIIIIVNNWLMNIPRVSWIQDTFFISTCNTTFPGNIVKSFCFSCFAHQNLLSCKKSGKIKISVSFFDWSIKNLVKSWPQSDSCPWMSIDLALRLNNFGYYMKANRLMKSLANQKVSQSSVYFESQLKSKRSNI